MKRGMRKTAAACCIALLLLSGCGKTAGNVNSDTADSSAVTEQSGSEPMINMGTPAVRVLKNQWLVRVIQI